MVINEDNKFTWKLLFIGVIGLLITCIIFIGMKK
jgi:hypothetical protein